MNKRGQRIQTGSPAATLIGIITLLFIFYILFLPPSEREALLGDETLEPGEAPRETLLSIPVGRVAFVSQDRFNHPLQNVYLVESRNAAIITSENPFMLRKTWFRDDRKRTVFSLTDLENTENVILSFQTPVRGGVLHIVLNGEEIFQSRVDVQNPPPVKFPKTLLRDTNALEFFVTGGFFTSKRYSFTDVKVIGDITDVAKQIATNTFSIAQVELDNFESAYLDFYPICQQSAVGPLSIELNGRIDSNAVPACESLNRQDLYGEDLRSGKNTLVFKIVRGKYRIEQVRVRTLVKPTRAFVEFFDVKPKLYDAILDNSRSVSLKIEFVDDGRTKRAVTNINGKLDSIDQRRPTFTRDISAVVREGNNYIEIRPLTELDIVKLEVRAE